MQVMTMTNRGHVEQDTTCMAASLSQLMATCCYAMDFLFDEIMDYRFFEKIMDYSSWFSSILKKSWIIVHGLIDFLKKSWTMVHDFLKIIVHGLDRFFEISTDYSSWF